jgi:glycosyltransferase involved in cell wall biosynthesis
VRKDNRDQFDTGNRLLFVNVARHEYQKGQDTLLEALALLRDVQDKIQVVIVGREGKLTGVLKKMIEEYKLQTTVLLAGHRSDVSNILAAADVFVFPSRFEGLPGALIEAEAAALPVIASDIPNNREVADETNALFFPVNGAEELAKAMKQVLLDNELRKVMSRNSLRIFQSKFQLEAIHKQMESLFTNLVRKNS